MRPNLNRIKILLVDDDLTMRELMRDMLKRAGFSNIMMAANAKAAIDIFNANQIDIIICDWVMPEVDGIEMTQYIRSLPPEKNSLVSIMMVSGNAGVHHITAARDAGINEYLVKPFNANDFFRRIIDLVEKPREFVIAEDFKGPSRRRRSMMVNELVDRRTNNIKPIKLETNNVLRKAAN